MNEELSYTIFNTAKGWMGILGSPRGLRRIILPRASAEETRQSLGNSLNHAVQSPRLFRDLIERLTIYFNGQKVPFPDKIDLSGATMFQREAWEVTRLIPYGEARSYKWVSEQIKKPKATRAVGQALGRNPLPIIVPCHRVLANDGKLGGFTGGLAMKKSLLHLEGFADF